jgi:hypothetical protein
MALPRRTASELYAEIRQLTRPGGDTTVHNYMAVIENMTPEAVLVETELFPRGAIEYYTAKNMGWDITEEDTQKWWMQERGGDQARRGNSNREGRGGSGEKGVNVNFETAHRHQTE